MTAVDRVRGRNLVPFRAFVKETFGDEGWNRFLGEVPARTSDVYDGLILPDAWYERTIDLDAMKVFFRMFADGDGERGALARRLAVRVAQHHDRQYMRPLLAGGPMVLLKRAAAQYREYYQGGSIAVGETREHGVRLILDDPGAPDYFCEDSLPGFLEEIIRLGKRRVVHVRQEACRNRGAPFCEIDVEWA